MGRVRQLERLLLLVRIGAAPFHDMDIGMIVRPLRHVGLSVEHAGIQRALRHDLKMPISALTRMREAADRQN